MDKLSGLTNAEWMVMDVIWTEKHVKAKQIIEILSGRTDWKPKTVKSIINRLLSKGIITYEQVGKEYIYYPELERDECVKIENDTFLQRVHNGLIKQMLVSFLDQHNLSESEIQELEQILHERKK